MDLNDYMSVALEINRMYPECRVYFDEDISTLKLRYLIEIDNKAVRYRGDASDFKTSLDLYNKLEDVIKEALKNDNRTMSGA